VEWFKVYDRIRTDPKLNTRPVHDRWAWICLLCLANEGEDDDRGNVRLRDEEIAFAVYLDVEQWEILKAYLVDRGMLDETEDGYRIAKWTALQGSGRTSAQRVRAHRERQRNVQPTGDNDGVTLQQRSSNDNETESNALEERRGEETRQEEIEQGLADVSRNETPPARAPNCPYDDILGLWGDICSHLPQPASVEESLKNRVRARWREHPDLEWWRTYFSTVAASDFLSGRMPPTNGRETSFQASYEWVMGPRNMAKVLAGNFSGNGSGQGSWSRSQQEYNEALRLLDDHYADDPSGQEAYAP